MVWSSMVVGCAVVIGGNEGDLKFKLWPWRRREVNQVLVSAEGGSSESPAGVTDVLREIWCGRRRQHRENR